MYLTCAAARSIFDKICLRMDGKRASAWTVRATPFFELDKFEAWGKTLTTPKAKAPGPTLSYSDIPSSAEAAFRCGA